MRHSFVLLVSILAAPLLLSAADTRLFDTIRTGDSGAIKAVLASGVDPNLRDETGATALMHAAIHGSVDDLKLLMDRGADVNAQNTYGSTALMRASFDAAKVRALLERGADVNLRAVDRSTALVAAARYGNAEAMRLLIAAGANPKATASDAINLLRVAYATEYPDVRKVLAEVGVVLSDATQLGPTALAQNLADPALVRTLLDLGASPKLEVTIATLRVPTLGLVASAGQIETARLLIDRGADPNATGSRGITPLMMAAASSYPDPSMVRLLIEKGADVRARDDSGRTAIDWALTQGETPVARLLRASGAPPVVPGLPAPAHVARPRSARDAIERAVARLQPGSPVFFERTKCISCHHQSLPAMAVRLASTRAVAVNHELAAHPAEATLASWDAAREQMLIGNPAIGGFVVNVTYGLTALAEEGIAPNRTTDAAAHMLAAVQHRDGSWSIPVGQAGGGIRPPLGTASPITPTALAIRGLTAYSPPGRRADTTARLARALTFLRNATPRDTQDEAFKLLGLLWSEAPAPELDRQARRLMALQHAGGEWSQLPTMKPDAYATGQALYALGASGLAPTSAAYQKGVRYLLRTQLEDGTWYVRSRGFGFQPYFETGFPHGKDQFISSAATAWAAIALAAAVQEPQRAALFSRE